MNVIISNKFQSLLTQLDIDVIKSISGEFEPEEIVSMFSNFFFNKMIIDITAIRGYENISNIQKLSLGLDMSKVIFFLDNSEQVNAPSYLSGLVSMGIYNFSKNLENIKYLIDNPNLYKDVARFQNLNASLSNDSSMSTQTTYRLPGENRIIGFKNVTPHAGATTLIYMLQRQLNNFYETKCLEINRKDFRYFNNKDMMSIDDNEFSSRLNNFVGNEVVLVDLNDSIHADLCDEVIYLMEPSTLKLNQMIQLDRTIFDRLNGKKIVLNRSLLDDADIKDFEYESRSKIFFNIPPLDDKKEKHKVLDNFISLLGFSSNVVSDKGGRLFGIRRS